MSDMTTSVAVDPPSSPTKEEERQPSEVGVRSGCNDVVSNRPSSASPTRSARSSSKEPSVSQQQTLLNQIQLLKSALPTQAELALVYEYSSEEGKKFERYVQGIIRKIHALDKERLALSKSACGPEGRRQTVRERHSKQQELSHMTAVYEFLNKEAHNSDRAQENKDKRSHARVMQAMRREGLLVEAKAKRDQQEQDRLKKLDESLNKWQDNVSKVVSDQHRVAQDAKRVREQRMEKLANMDRVTYLGANDELPTSKDAAHPTGGADMNTTTGSMSRTGGAYVQHLTDAEKRAIEAEHQQEINEHLKRAELMKLHRTNVANGMVGHVKELLSHIKERRAEEDELKYQQLQEKCAEADDRFKGVIQRRADMIKSLRNKSTDKRQRVRENRESQIRREEEKRAILAAECEKRLSQAEARLMSSREGPAQHNDEPIQSVTSASGETCTGSVPRRHVATSFYDERKGKLKIDRTSALEKAAQLAAEATARKNENTKQMALRLVERTTRVGGSLGVSEAPEKKDSGADARKRERSERSTNRSSRVESASTENESKISAARARQRNLLAERARERLEAEVNMKDQKLKGCATGKPPRAASPTQPSESASFPSPKNDDDLALTRAVPQADSPPPEIGDSKLLQSSQSGPHYRQHPPSSEPPRALPDQEENNNSVDESSMFSLPTLGFLLSAAPSLSSIPIGERTVTHEMHSLRTMYLTMRREVGSSN